MSNKQNHQYESGILTTDYWRVRFESTQTILLRISTNQLTIECIDNVATNNKKLGFWLDFIDFFD